MSAIYRLTERYSIHQCARDSGRPMRDTHQRLTLGAAARDRELDAAYATIARKMRETGRDVRATVTEEHDL
jgi:hypothetical protein